jgi:nanoRNase/pAp phosphatase (c-di-AMP/oligoRNAs hydrolase)
VGAYESFVVVMHDNPDPDAIAAGWALRALCRDRLGKTPRLVGGGAIVRAENRHLVKVLDPPIELVHDLEVSETTAAILVDCGYAADNHLLAQEQVHPVAVIDHHLPRATPKRRLAFRDVRPKAAAAASIAGSYLREQKIRPGARLATALYYAIRTETRGAQVHHSRLDRSVLRWLAGHINPAWVAEIENAPLPRAYFVDLARALQGTFLYGDAAFCLLPRAHGTEIVGEVADLLIRYEEVRCVLCAALVTDDLVMSVRTVRGGRNAAVLVQATLSGLRGTGGGHGHRAGGKIPAASLAGTKERVLENELRRRWLDACKVDQRRGKRLVSARELTRAAPPGASPGSTGSTRSS